MRVPLFYRIWQAPFANSKLRPIFQHNDLKAAKRVLDFGCGPGTNTSLFADTDYLGLDINRSYVETAARRTGREFRVADAKTYVGDRENQFDFILVNSLLHHIDSETSLRILRQLGRQLSADGSIHILDLVLPDSWCAARFLALSDRGNFVRPLPEWKRIFRASFHETVLETYPIKFLGLTLWQMVYFKGTSRGGS